MTHATIPLAPRLAPRLPDAVRQAVRRLENPGAARRPSLPLGIPSLDAALPDGGVPRGCVHEVRGDESATGFCAVLLGRAGARGGALLWLARGRDLYPPGLVRYGIKPGRLLTVSGLRRTADAAWAMEEALRSKAVKGVVAEMGPVTLAASRRLALAAEGPDALGLVLSVSPGAGSRNSRIGVATAVSRWHVTATPSTPATPAIHAAPAPESPKWRVRLPRCRGGRPRNRSVRWKEQEGWKDGG